MHPSAPLPHPRTHILPFAAASNLDAATCQITYQLKILTTAVFAVTMLGKRISATRWFSLVVLVAGIVLVQLPSLAAGASKATVAGNPVVGLSAVIAACFLSGFAGVWLEKILKGSDTSIWVRKNPFLPPLSGQAIPCSSVGVL